MNTINLQQDHAEIIINSSKYGIKKALIDLDDVDKIKNFTWRICNNLFYIAAYERKPHNIRKKFLLHRLIMNCPEELVIDHINHDPLDNRKCNLRICTQKQNMQNRITLSKSKARNVTWHKKDKKWQVSLKLNGESIYFGQFSNYEEAKKVAKAARLKYFTHSIEREKKMDKLELLLFRLKQLKCKLGFHKWIYIGDKDSIFTKRYCEDCHRQEQFCNEHYYRIGDISFEAVRELRSKY